MSYHCSLALVEEFSGQSCLSTELCARLKSIRTAERSCFDGKKMETCRRSLSGMTYEPSMASRGAEQWISYLRDSHVSHSLSPAFDEVTRITVTSGRKPFASFEKFSQATHSWKTFKGFSVPGRKRPRGIKGSATSELFSTAWPKRGMMQSGQCWELMIVEGPIKGKDSGSLPVTWGDKIRIVVGGALPTPTTKANAYAPSMKKHVACRRWMLMFGGGKIRPWNFEWMMDFPIGWTDLGPLAMHKFQSWQRGLIKN